MARLPQPGSDSGQWGDILNDYLAQSHNSDGSLKNDTITTTKIANDAITEAKLDSGVRTKLNTVGGTPLVESVAGKTGAVTLVKGDVGLGNVDDTSDANKPIATATQTALDSKASTVHTHSIANITNLQTTLDGKQASGSYATTTDLTNGLASKADTAATVLLAGNQTITDTKNFTGTLQSGGQTVVATNDARLTNERVPTNGSVTSPKLSAGPAIADQVLSYDGAGLAWTTITPSGAVSDASPSVKGIVQLTGDLAGTAGAPIVAKVNGVTVTGTPATGHLLTATSGTAATWQAAAAVSVASTDITDSTTTGRAVLTAADTAAARTAVGLGNVNNTSDASKPISSATQTALDAKQSTSAKGQASGYASLDSNTRVPTAQLGTGTANTTTYLRGDGSWQTVSSGTVASTDITDSTATGRAVLTATDTAAARTAIGLGNVNNTSDASKPISTATQTALDLKASVSSVDAVVAAIPETVRDTMGTALVAGANVTITPNDGADTITISATGGGGGAVDSVNSQTGTVVLTQDNVLDGTTFKQFSATEKTKLSGIATGATANATDSQLRDRSTHTGTQASSTVSDFTERVQDEVGSFLTAGTNISLNYDDTGNALTINSTGGGGGDSYFDTYVLNAADYGVVFDGTTNIRTSFQSALTAALALTATGDNVILQLPSGVGPITTVNGTSLANVYTGGSYGTDHGFKLPVNMSGHLTIRGRGPRTTVFKLSSNAKSLFVINQAANYDVAQHFTFEDFGVDNNATTGLSHIVFGNQPNYDTPQRYMSFRDITMRRIDVWNVPFDHVMSTTKKLAFMFRGRHAGNYEAGTTPGSLPLTPYPGEAGAEAANWTYAVDILAEDVKIYDAQRGIHVVCDITQETSHWVDRIRYVRCLHEQAAPYVNSSPQTSFYIGGNCLGGRAEIIDCKSVNVGDDGIEFGGLQELYVHNFEVVNPILNGILVRYSQPPADASAVKIVIEGLKSVITAEAINNDTPIDPVDSVAKRRSVRGRAFEIIAENDFAGGTLGQLIVRNSESIVEGGYFDSLIRSRMIGWNHTGPVAHTIIENCRAVVRNLHLDYGSGEYIVSMFSTRGYSAESGVKPLVQIRNFEAVFENATSDGAKYEIHGLWPMGNGEVDVDGFRLTLIDTPSAAVVRSALVAPGYRPSAYSTTRALSRIQLHRLSGRTVGDVASTRRGLLVESTELFDSAYISSIDIKDWALTADVDLGSAGTNAANIMYGEGNIWSRIDGNGARNPQAGNYTLRAYDGLVAITSTAAARTVTLPSAAAVQPGRIFTVLDESNAAGTNDISITRAGSDTWLGGATTKTISTNGGSIRFYSNGNDWIVA